MKRTMLGILVLALAMLACATPTPVAKVVQPTYTAMPTYTPYPTQVPPTQVPPTKVPQAQASSFNPGAGWTREAKYDYTCENNCAAWSHTSGMLLQVYPTMITFGIPVSGSDATAAGKALAVAALDYGVPSSVITAMTAKLKTATFGAYKSGTWGFDIELGSGGDLLVITFARLDSSNNSG